MKTQHNFLFLILGVAVSEGIITLNITETARQGTFILNNTGKENCSLTRVNPNDVREYFRFNDDQGLVLEKALDLEVIYNVYDVDAGIQLTVRCIGGEPENQVSIHVVPVNEFNPEFIRKPYNIEVPEDSLVGTPVFCLFCSDKLVHDGDKIQYGHVSNFTFIPHEIQGLDGAHKFTIDPLTGNITTKQQFDFESRNKLFYLKVQAQDEGGRTGDASIRINVTDVDDNPPKFTRPGCDGVTCTVSKYSAEIDSFKEGKITSLLPAPIYAVDMDTGINNKLEYTMESEDNDDIASNVWLNSTTGELFIQEPFYNLTNVTDDGPITLLFDLTATEVSTHGYSTNVSLILTVYRSLTTIPPSTTSERPETSDLPPVPLTKKSDNGLALMLVEIIVPAVIVIGILIVVIVLLIRRKRKAKERSKYEVKAGANGNQNVIGDRDLAVQVRSSYVINPYELVNMYDSSHYARFDSMEANQDTGEEGQGRPEGQIPAGDFMLVKTSSDNDNIGEIVDGNDNLYARVEKKRTKSNKSKAADLFGSENHGYSGNHGDLQDDGVTGDDYEDDEDKEDAPDSLKDVKSIEY